jgi:hypothetical protein
MARPIQERRRFMNRDWLAGKAKAEGKAEKK